MLIHVSIYNAQFTHYMQSQAVQQHKPTPQEAPTMNIRDTAQLIGDAIAAFTLILLPFSFAWARFILTGGL